MRQPTASVANKIEHNRILFVTSLKVTVSLADKLQQLVRKEVKLDPYYSINRFKENGFRGLHGEVNYTTNLKTSN